MSLLKEELKMVHVSLYELAQADGFFKLSEIYGIPSSAYRFCFYGNGKYSYTCQYDIPLQMVKEVMVNHFDAHEDYIPKRVINQSTEDKDVWQKQIDEKIVYSQRFVSYHKSERRGVPLIIFKPNEFSDYDRCDEVDDFALEEDYVISEEEVDGFLSAFDEDGRG